MLTAKNREPAKTKAEGTPARPKPKVETADWVQANPLWTQLATRVQAKLTVSAPDDPYEREADRIADQVMRMPEPVIQRARSAYAAGGSPCPNCQKEKRASVHQKADDSGASVPEGFVSNLGPGQALDAATRDFMEPRFAQDFGQVRVHTDGRAAESAQAVNARAYTFGRDVVFGVGQYVPSTAGGRRLLAHELTHVLQQGLTEREPSRAVDARGAELRLSLSTHAPAAFIQRDPTGSDRAAFREATVAVRWTEDDRDFYHRVINAIAASAEFRGVGKESLWQPFHDPAFHVFRSYGVRLSPKPGDRVQLRARAFFDPANFHGRVNSASLEPEQAARLREAKITGILTPLEIFGDRSANELGPHGSGELSFSSEPSVSAASVGGLKWSVTAGGGSVKGGDDGKATFTAGPSPGPVRLELKTVSGFSAGTVVASITVKVLAVQDMVSRDPNQPERLTVNREGLTPELLAEEFYGNKAKATAIRAVWDEKAKGEPWTVATRIPKGMWVGVEYRHLTSQWQKIYDASVDITSRTDWGAKPPITGDPKRSYEPYTVPLEDVLDSIVVHHAGNKGYKTMNDVQDLHLGEKERADIGYHYGISLSGQVFEGRPIGVKGAQVEGSNTGKIGIVLLADLDPENKGLSWYQSDKDEDPLSSEMEQSLLKLIHFLKGKYPNIKYLGGHDDYDPRRFCPGKQAMDKMVTWQSNTYLWRPP